jgi:hypothetical protein
MYRHKLACVESSSKYKEKKINSVALKKDSHHTGDG